MTEWEPATEAEAAMRDALRANDQELYFRILARSELLLPVSADALAGRAPTGWGTWTTGGRTHVLAFTSDSALRACLADSAGAARRLPYFELAGSWPNLEWWLAINPGLPIEGYLPAWFVSQLARGDVRLPGRTMAARARLERAETAARARATAVVPGRTVQPDPGRSIAVPGRSVLGDVEGQPGPPTAPVPPVPAGPPAAPPASGQAARAAGPAPSMPAADSTLPASNQLVPTQAGARPADPATTSAGPGGLPRRPVPGGTAPRSDADDSLVRRPGAADAPAWLPQTEALATRRPALADALARRTLRPAGEVAARVDAGVGGSGAAAGTPPTGTTSTGWYDADARSDTQPPAAGPPGYAQALSAPVIPGAGISGSIGAGGVTGEPRSGGGGRGADEEPAPSERARPAGIPTSGSGRLSDSQAAVDGPHASRPPVATEPTPSDPRQLFTPANEVEKNLLAAAGGGSTDTFLSTMLLARVLLPVAAESASGARPGDDGFAWRTEILDGETYVVVFTSPERLTDHVAEPVETVGVKFVQLIRHWPDDSWSFAVNPGTPVGAKLPGAQIVALASWAADVGLGDDAGGSETAEPPPAPAAAPRSTYEPAREEPGRPTMMQKTISPSQIAYYVERGYDRVSGFVHRANEVAHLTTPAKLHAALGLGYTGSPFAHGADHIYVIRWPAYRPSLYRIPYGGQHEAAMRAMEGWVIERAPFRGNGFAPGDSSDVVAEFKVDSVRLPHGSQLWRISADGTEKKIAILDSDGPTWLPTGED